MRKFLLICLIILCGYKSKAQLKHSIALDYIIYGNVFSPPQKSFFNKENYRFVWPQISYTLTKDKQSISISTQVYGKELYYHQNLVAGDLERYYNFALTGLYGLELIKKHGMSLNINGGLKFGLYNHSYIVWQPDSFENIIDGGKEWTLGFTVGANPKIEIWKGLFLNGNIRYTINPFAYYKKHLNAFYVGVGLGYEFGRRKE
ncbi:MAG TPA: hypothetical protein VLZ83_03450 [Edaphocola sp.]|nr:hypothetical protein [Edaphocola sp.]